MGYGDILNNWNKPDDPNEVVRHSILLLCLGLSMFVGTKNIWIPDVKKLQIIKAMESNLTYHIWFVYQFRNCPLHMDLAYGQNDRNLCHANIFGWVLKLWTRWDVIIVIVIIAVNLFQKFILMKFTYIHCFKVFLPSSFLECNRLTYFFHWKHGVKN